MRDLKRGLVLLFWLLALSTVLTFGDAGGTAGASAPSSALQTPTVDLVVTISPAMVQPGQQASVTITLKNSLPGPVAPDVKIILPSSVSARFNDLPSGTLFNAQSGTLSWQPVMAGDGTELQLSLPIVAQVADPHNPEQTVSVIVLAGGEEIKQDAKFWIGLTPTASISLNPPQVAAGQPMQLIGDVNVPGPVAQLWSLGDGRIVEAENPSVFYPSPGTYEVVFQASTSSGVISASTTVNIVAQTVAKFTVSDSTPALGTMVQFVNESGGRQPLSYLWDFGDGSLSSEANPYHAFQVPGTYDVRLIVTGATGQSQSVETVEVGSAPIADFVIADSTQAGAILQGQAFADESAISVTWDMGDGRTYEGSVMNHVYWTPGEYPVTVIVANEYGETRMLRLVQVSPGPLYLFLPLVHLNTDAAGFGPQPEPPAPDPQQPPPQVIVTEPVEQPAEVEASPEELPLLELPAGLTPQELLLAYINEARRINGLGSLNPVMELNAVAQQHAEDMALNGITSHTGSDGSIPALRVLLSGYPGGYAGEATAWGMAEAVEPVRYWLTSPGHRSIILNPAARDVGVGFSQSYDAPSIWYWTAEFASMDLPVVQVPVPPSMTPTPEPMITLLGPPANGEFTLVAGTKLIFTWSWPLPLAADERFGVYLNSQGRTVQIGTVGAPQSGDQYEFTTSADNVPTAQGQRSWFVQLENTLTGEMREQSESRTILFASDS